MQIKEQWILNHKSSMIYYCNKVRRKFVFLGGNLREKIVIQTKTENIKMYFGCRGKEGRKNIHLID